MALQGSGQISLSNIATEMNQIAQNISLGGMSTSTSLNDQSPFKPNESQPHGMSEFYSYDHSFSSFKPLMGGTKNPSYSKWFNHCGDDIKFFYAHDGSKDSPNVGDKLYTNDRGSYILFPAAVTKIEGMEGPSSQWVAVTDSSGKITQLNSCEGIEGEDTGIGSPSGPDEDPFRR